MSYLRNIAPLDDENLPGLITISVVKKDDILSYPASLEGIAVEEITFKPGKDWIRWSATYNTANFINRSNDSDQGIIREQELPFVLPKSSAIEAMLSKAERDEFIVLVQDKNGFRELFGSFQKPVRFSYDKQTGSSSGRNQYDCRFFSEAIGNKLIYPYDFTNGADFSNAQPVIIRRGAIDGPVLAVAPAGSTVVITSPYSFGFQMIAS
jgi:hypothetical protein